MEGGAWPHQIFEVDALLVPIGFGQRGTEGKIRAIRYAREHKVPFFGICLGMQCMTIEYARNVCGIKDATSSEFDADTEHAVISTMAPFSSTTGRALTLEFTSSLAAS